MELSGVVGRWQTEANLTEDWGEQSTTLQAAGEVPSLPSATAHVAGQSAHWRHAGRAASVGNFGAMVGH